MANTINDDSMWGWGRRPPRPKNVGAMPPSRFHETDGRKRKAGRKEGRKGRRRGTAREISPQGFFF